MMQLKSATTDNLIDVLDRVLGKSIVIEAWVRSASLGIDGRIAVDALSVACAEIIEGYGEDARTRELFPDLFPYWRKDLWTK
jgi:hypothetical protein